MGVTAAIIGIVHSILNELKQRIAFLEAKKSLEVNMKIEEHSQVQERLLLSVLPKYVADKVRMDMGVTKSDQFKKIYMSRHENVRYLQHKTNSPVDMRVGIHTGAILAGILGQRQWQFDVYSRDVELANKMESSGMAGRVHISEKTRLCLRDQFVVEPAYGEKREPALRLAGLTTYFITKVLVPFEERNRSLTEDHLAIDMQSEKEEGFKDMID
uniref:adenylate cyclase n=1 Tax=Megaselia scalaris TaxID=36166 RepID=T1GCZ3_MEGSC